MYHVSLVGNHDSILKKGLDASGPSPWPEDEYPKGTYLFDDIKIARQYGFGNSDPFEIWQVNIVNYKVQDDPITKGAFYIAEPIDKKDIKFKENHIEDVVNNNSKYQVQEAEKDPMFSSAVNNNIGTKIWKKLDAVADEILEHGYGKPIRDLIQSESMFAIEKYGKQLCEPDVLSDRFHQLRQKNKVLKNISFAERMVMLLTHWRGLGESDKSSFNYGYNPFKLKFSKWVLEPQTLYRGMPESTYTALGDDFVLDHQPFYSFTFLPSVAEKFTAAGYASGHFVPVSRLHGYVVKTTARPIDFHIFMGGTLSDEMEVLLKAPVTIELYGSVNMKEVKGKKLK